MQLVMSRRPMFLLPNVSSDTLHEKAGGIYSGGDLITWTSAILAREGAVAPVQCGPDCRPAVLFRPEHRVLPQGRDNRPDCAPRPTATRLQWIWGLV
jgi:hypothetical protein